MQSKKYIYLLLLATCFFASCEDSLNESVKFDMTVESEGSHMEGDVLVVKKDAEIVFNFSGNPDFITFYSGETGHVYKHRERTLLSKDEISSALHFSSFAQYGTIPGAFAVYLSTSFGELSLDRNKKEDSTKIVNHNWIDISDLCNLPTTSSTDLKDAVVPLDEYLGEELTLAFVYKPYTNTTAQPTWEIQSLRIVNTSKEDGSESFLQAVNMAFTPFDMFVNGSDAYNSGSVGGIWNVGNIASSPSRIRMQSSSIGVDLNEDWLISKPMTINACSPDTGEGIKTIISRLDTFTHQYEEPGTYEVTLVARNSNFEHSSEVVRELIIKVVE